MKRTRLVSITRTSEVSLLGSADQRTLNSIRRITKGQDHLARVFAEPVLDANGESISWYTDLPGSISSYNDLTESDRQFLLRTWQKVCDDLIALRVGLCPADQVVLDNVIETPGVNAFHLVGHELLVTDWSSLRIGHRPKNKNIGIETERELGLISTMNDPTDLSEVRDFEPLDQTHPDAVCLDSSNSRVDLSADERNQSNLERPKIGSEEISEFGFLKTFWFWGALFLLLCFLNWFLLIDACGVAGVHFLNFCDI